MATQSLSTKDVIDAVADAITAFKAANSKYANTRIARIYVYSDEFKWINVKDFAVGIRPAPNFIEQIPRLGMRMEDYYSVELVCILKLDRSQYDHWFTDFMAELADHLMHNTLSSTVEIVGGNVSWEVIDAADTNFPAAILRFQGRKIISITK